MGLSVFSESTKRILRRIFRSFLHWRKRRSASGFLINAMDRPSRFKRMRLYSRITAMVTVPANQIQNKAVRKEGDMDVRTDTA